MLVIFDFDNTLEEFRPHEKVVEEGIFDALSEKYGIPQAKLREVFRNIKSGHEHTRSIPKDYDRKEWFRELFHVFHLPEPVDTWTHIYWEQVTSRVRLFPNTISTLTEIAQNHTVCILSDSDGSLPVKLRRIDRLGLTPHVDKIFTTDTVGHNKPHPQAFLQVLEYYHAAAENCVMIGDRPPIDLMAAHELGMRTIWLQEGATSNARTHSFAYVDAEAQTMDDLPSIIASFANFHQTTAQAAQKHSSKSSKHILTTL